jgi:rod shape determining protein RodA
MKKKLDFKNFSIYFDQYLFISITLLSVMGLFFLYSASQEDLNTVIKQSIFVGFGLILMLAVSQPDPDFYKTFSGIFLVLSILLIFATMIFGKEINGAKRWLDLGFFTLQTSEIIKISLPIFLASYLYNKPLPISLKHTFITLILIGSIFFLVYRQPDLGTGLVVFMAGVYILFLAGLSWRFIFTSFGWYCFHFHSYGITFYNLFKDKGF